MQSDSKSEGLVAVRAPKFSPEIDAELFNRAQKELAAFVAAVNRLHSGEQGRAADDWLLELTALEKSGKGTPLDLRSVTIGAAIRLAQRVSIPWQNKSANQFVIRWKSASAKHEFQQDSDHTSKTPHKSVPEVQFTQSCKPGKSSSQKSQA